MASHFPKSFKTEVLPDKELQRNSQIIVLKWNSTGTRLSYSKTDGSVRIWKYNSGNFTDTLLLPKLFEKAVGDINWDPIRETRFATIGRDPYVKIYETTQNNKNYHQIANIKLENESINMLLRYSRCGKYIAVVDRSGTVSILNCQNNFEVLLSFKNSQFIYDFEWSQDSNSFLLALGNGEVVIYLLKINNHLINGNEMEMEDDKENKYSIELAHTIKIGPRIPATTVTCDREGKYIFIGTNDGQVSVWDTQSLICIKSFSSIDEPIGTVSVSSDGKFIAMSYEYDSPAKIFDIDTMEEVFTVEGCKSTKMVGFVEFSPVDMTIAHSGNIEGKCTVLIPEKNSKKKQSRNALKEINVTKHHENVTLIKESNFKQEVIDIGRSAFSKRNDLRTSKNSASKTLTASSAQYSKSEDLLSSKDRRAPLDKNDSWTDDRNRRDARDPRSRENRDRRDVRVPKTRDARDTRDVRDGRDARDTRDTRDPRDSREIRNRDLRDRNPRERDPRDRDPRDRDPRDRDPRDRDPRDRPIREARDPRDRPIREARGPRDARDPRDTRDTRDPRDTRERDTRNPRDRDPRDRDTRNSREPRDSRDIRESRDSRDSRNRRIDEIPRSEDKRDNRIRSNEYREDSRNRRNENYERDPKRRR
ncbi:hypothetical protein B5S30_g3989 [[Candida] boidinii]|nr:hypothetical protein B5S30_g3989 [[Candida] boidinii]